MSCSKQQRSSAENVSPGPCDANEEKLLQLNYRGSKNPANNI